MDRNAFGYESDTESLKAVFVPDPLAAEAWERVSRSHRVSDSKSSLLEHIIRSGILTEEAVLLSLAEASGARVLRSFRTLPVNQWEGEARVLFSNGYLPLDDPEGRRLVAGGPIFPPRLKDCLGRAANRWEWVLISPLNENPERRGGPREVALTQSGTDPVTTADDWLEELLRSLSACGHEDIHFERFGEKLEVRVRKDGRLEPVAIRRSTGAADCLRLIKRRAGLPTAEEALPGDGRLCLEDASGALVYRAASLKTVTGESIVLRQSGKGTQLSTPCALGIPGELLQAFRDVVRNHPGLIVASGHTGSGKTTTICSLLRDLGAAAGKVLTIEDPVEHDLPDATQSNVNPIVEWTFDTALRAYLRQDPDLIFVGEIRDAASAETAVRAAVTGHTVLTTLHARGPWLALDRFREWNIEPGLLAESVRLVIHQLLEHPPAVPETRARFTWIEPEPEEVETHLTGKAPRNGIP